MSKKELDAILSGIRHVQRIIEAFGFENYPYEMTMDEDLRKMYYKLNDMAILLNQKIDNNQ